MPKDWGLSVNQIKDFGIESKCYMLVWYALLSHAIYIWMYISVHLFYPWKKLYMTDVFWWISLIWDTKKKLWRWWHLNLQHHCYLCKWLTCGCSNDQWHSHKAATLCLLLNSSALVNISHHWHDTIGSMNEWTIGVLFLLYVFVLANRATWNVTVLAIV